MFTLKIVKGADLAEGVQPEVKLPERLTRFAVGRDPSNAWPIPDRTRAISARHCEFVAAGARVVLRDLSTNGTFVNGSTTRLAGEHVLRDGDRIEMGPYVVEVRGQGPHAGAGVELPDTIVTPLPLPSPQPSALPSRTPSVEATAPQRGGDPAAMLARGLGVRPKREGLTEILRAAPPVDNGDLAVTKIRVAPKGRPAAAAPAPVDPVLAALARGLHLPAEDLAGRSPADAAAQVAALARAAVAALRQLAPAHDPLRTAPTNEAALLALLALGAGAEALLQNMSRQAMPPGDADA
jgi:predicted component of type VI protein secretion system